MMPLDVEVWGLKAVGRVAPWAGHNVTKSDSPIGRLTVDCKNNNKQRREEVARFTSPNETWERGKTVTGNKEACLTAFVLLRPELLGTEVLLLLLNKELNERVECKSVQNKKSYHKSQC